MERFTGDGIVVFFNDPLPCDDAPLRSVRMALTMRQRVQELADGWQRRGHELALGVGIAQGYATLGRVGDADRFEYASVGSVTNLAARLCAEAAPWQILVTQRVNAAAEEVVVNRLVGELSLRGFPGQTAPSRFPGSTPRRSLLDYRDGARLTLAELSDDERNERFDRIQERMRGVWEIMRRNEEGGVPRRCRPLGQLGPRWRAKWAPYSKPSAPHSPSPIIPSANRHDQSLAEPRSEGAPWPQVHPAHAHDCEDPGQHCSPPALAQLSLQPRFGRLTLQL